jgi:lysozyme family protein
VTGFLVPTPYLWSVANHDTRGTFVSEGVFDPDAASSHAGAAVLLTDLLNRGLVPA